ncbi:MAG: iron(III) transport system substrate-binding protein [Alphaproteobacteria bacterium]|nr:iron(III) transport system substrate-binding protein [Alphaproteobacteria bacterium]
MSTQSRIRNRLLALRRFAPRRSPPPCGEGTGVGLCGDKIHQNPTPNPSPQGGGEHTEYAARAVTYRTTPTMVHMYIVAAIIAFATAPASAQSPNDILTYKGPDREQKLIEGARKEGQVVIYSALIVSQAMRPIADKFGKKYPFVKISHWRADSEDIASKLSAEVRANNVVADVFEGTGVGEIAVGAGLTQPYSTPAIEAFPVEYRDPGGMWTPTRLSYYSIAYNTRLVPADKVPKNYDDLLDPQWKGKMAWRIGSASGTPLFLSNLRLAWGEDKARAYFDKLKEQKIVNFGAGSARTLVDRVIASEYSIALNIFAHHPLISKGKGAPVNSKLLDPVASTAATMGVVKGAKHPYAAMLLIDYILSKEGQAILSSAEYFPADPTVAPLPSLASVVPKTAGVPENFIGPDKLTKYTDSSEEIFRTLFR